jgi:hypothetical protein
MKDDDFSIFINEGALPISSINDNSCAIDHKKSLLSQTFKFTNCFGEFKTNINFDSYFKYYLDDKEVLPNRVDNFLAFPISGNLNLSVVYQYWPAYIGALISLFGILIIFLNKYYLRIKAYIFL